MIDLGTLAALVERGHERHADRGRCDSWAALNLESTVRAVYGNRSRLSFRTTKVLQVLIDLVAGWRTDGVDN